MTPQDALRMARERGYDLVEVSPQATPPVCRFLDFNKFRYEVARREREAKKKHRLAKLKEIKFKPRIEDHDYHVKLQQLKKFLARGDKAKVTMVFRGREMAHTELGRRVLDRLVTDLTGFGRVERTPILEGRFMTMIFSPDHGAVKRPTKPQPANLSTQPAGKPAAASPATSKEPGTHANTQNA